MWLSAKFGSLGPPPDDMDQQYLVARKTAIIANSDLAAHLKGPRYRRYMQLRKSLDDSNSEFRSLRNRVIEMKGDNHVRSLNEIQNVKEGWPDGQRKATWISNAKLSYIFGLIAILCVTSVISAPYILATKLQAMTDLEVGKTQSLLRDYIQEEGSLLSTAFEVMDGAIGRTSDLVQCLSSTDKGAISSIWSSTKERQTACAATNVILESLQQYRRDLRQEVTLFLTELDELLQWTREAEAQMAPTSFWMVIANFYRLSDSEGLDPNDNEPVTAAMSTGATARWRACLWKYSCLSWSRNALHVLVGRLLLPTTIANWDTNTTLAASLHLFTTTNPHAFLSKSSSMSQDPTNATLLSTSRACLSAIEQLQPRVSNDAMSPALVLALEDWDQVISQFELDCSMSHLQAIDGAAKIGRHEIAELRRRLLMGGLIVGTQTQNTIGRVAESTRKLLRDNGNPRSY